MNNFIKKLFLMVLVIGAMTVLLNLPVSAQPTEQIPRKIVVFQKNFVNEAAQIELLRNAGAVFIKSLAIVNAAAVYLTPEAEMALKGKPEILRIEDDIIVQALGRPKPPEPPPPQSQTTPWGITRIGAPSAWPTTKGLAIKVAILDTGIDLDHPDLAANIKGNVNCINPAKSGDDDNGHGTAVAGVVAAINNSIGVVGVGPEIYLYAVKVLGRTGGGNLSDIIDGLEWCVNNDMAIINISLGCSQPDSETFHTAIQAVDSAGIVMVGSAGDNAEETAHYPGAYPEVICLSSMDEDDQLAWFSDYGDAIDVIAPGDNINSTWKGGGYATHYGASLATAHAVGTIALLMSRPVGDYDLDSDSEWDPTEVKNKLYDTAEDLGLDVKQQGAGLVRADLAIQ